MLSTAITGAEGGKPMPPEEVAHKQAKLDQQIQHVQEEAANRQAEVDQKAQHLVDQTAKKQAEIDRRAQHVLDEAAKKRAAIDRKAAKLGLSTSATSAPVQQEQQPATEGSTSRAVQPAVTQAAPTVASGPAAVSAPAARHVVHETAKLADRRAGVERHVAHEQAEIDEQRTRLASHVAKKQAQLDDERAEIGGWLAQRLADLLRRRLGITIQVNSSVSLPPPTWEPTPVQKGAEKPAPAAATPVPPAPTAEPVPAGTPAPPPVIAPNGEIPSGTGAVSPAEARSGNAATPAPAAAAAPAAQPQGAVVPTRRSGKGGGKQRGSGGNSGQGEAATPHPHRAPAAVVLHPLARAVTEIPRTVWVGMSGLGIIALALALVSVLQSRRALRLAAAQRALRADMATLSSAVMPAVPTMLGGLALSVASKPASGPASGGDFHDAFELTDGRAAVIVGDVAGKGRDAVAAPVLVRHTMRAFL
jgi:hypothetical protein